MSEPSQHPTPEGPSALPPTGMSTGLPSGTPADAAPPVPAEGSGPRRVSSPSRPADAAPPLPPEGAASSLAGPGETGPGVTRSPSPTPAEASQSSEARDGVSNEETGAAAGGAPEEEASPDPQPRSLAELHALLGLHRPGWRLPGSVRLRGWIATVAVTVIAAALRLVGLSHPRELMFDEIYYVKDAYALGHNGYESTWGEGADKLFAAGDFTALTTEPSFVVHPQLGKWLIALGGEVFGWGSPVGWRISVAICGILTVALLARLTLRLTGSPAVAALAGFALAIDGVAITESRIGLLDGMLGFFALLSIYCLVRDREWWRARMAQRLAGSVPGGWAPVPLFRPWLLAAGVSAGLTCSIKWSGAYLLAVMGFTVLTWDGLALRRLRVRSWLSDAVLHRGLLDFLHLVPTAFAVYVAGWFSWFTHPAAYKHGWAASMRAAGTPQRTWLPDSLNDLLEYHLSMYRFHVGLDTPHPYMAQPIGWLAQWRPTSFYWKGTDEMASVCPQAGCVQAVTSIGNIVLWWAAIVALVFIVVVGLRRRDWRLWVPLIGYAGLYLPWFAYSHRTIFTFYTVEFVPLVMLVLALMLGEIAGWVAPVPGSAAARREAQMMADGEAGPGMAAPRGLVATYLGFGLKPTHWALPEAWAGVPVWRQRTEGIALAVALMAGAAVFAVLWWPIWTGHTVTYTFWHLHMLLPSWI